ncbi:hypothetical protein [Nitrosospira sp. Is2]|uniref:hypothetical protein n=1 Tax=Nitrosospira sp. Is2 TaxID=3080532 RepID=UPI002952B86F|nr:hypothetical protein [Nitrosospira sp. Is2]WON74339.1 hypothetical protein R5L00_02270 [Nitrosospira sp. Is2]
MVEILPILLKLSNRDLHGWQPPGHGLRLNFQEALGALRNVRFALLSVLCGFVLCPALAYLLTKVIPIGIPMQTIASFLAAHWLARRAETRQWV